VESGHDGSLNLLGWFLRRMRSPRAACPYYFLPFFIPERAFHEAKLGVDKFQLVRSFADGNFCMAVLHLIPTPERIGRKRRVQINVFMRNWQPTRFFDNLVGMSYLFDALQTALPRWDFGHGVHWTTSIVSRDLSRARLALSLKTLERVERGRV
jgi:hypothetical protein